MSLKAVFDVQPSSKYGDDISRRYSFRARRDYLDVAHACLNDWIVFRQTGGGRRGDSYIGIARVVSVNKDPHAAGFFCAQIADYIPFIKPVPISVDGRYFEAFLRAIPRPDQVGQALHGKALRDIFDADFDQIVLHGFGSDPLLVNLPSEVTPGLADEGPIGPTPSKQRPIERVLTSRLFRDRVFRDVVGSACGFRCAFSRDTGPNPDGFGHFEGQAAHLQGVAAGGPDTVHNGVFASGAPHWFFDQYVMSIDPDYTLVIAPNLLRPAVADTLLPAGSRIHLPSDQRLWPHARYLEVHRAEFRRQRKI